MSKPRHAVAHPGRWLIHVGVMLLAVALVCALTLMGQLVRADREADREAAEDTRTVEEWSDTLRRRQWEKAVIWNRRLMLTGSQAGYRDTLTAPGDVIGTLRIPELDLRLPVRHGTGDATLSQGLGHMPSTALPVGGKGNRPVIVGHRGLPGKTLFTRLPELHRGSMVYVTVLGRTLAYRVQWKREIRPGDVRAIRPEEGEDLLSLLTCTPYGVNTRRLLVTGVRAPYPFQKAPAVREPWAWWKWLLLALLLLAAVCTIIAITWHRHRTRARMRA